MTEINESIAQQEQNFQVTLLYRILPFSKLFIFNLRLARLIANYAPTNPTTNEI